MIDVLLLNRNTDELAAMARQIRDTAALLGDDDWNVSSFSSAEKLLSCMSSASPDFAGLDVSISQGISVAEQLRSGNAGAFLMLIADASMSPMDYLKPSIMPGALLLRPYSKTQLQKTLRDSMKKMMESLNLPDDRVFHLPQKEGDRLIPYSRLYFFEAREKRVFANLGNQEFGFYSTIDRLEADLPAGFMRCHRSFIVSKAHIDRIFLSKSYILMDNGITVPLSRSYKSIWKEVL